MMEDTPVKSDPIGEHAVDGGKRMLGIWILSLQLLNALTLLSYATGTDAVTYANLYMGLAETRMNRVLAEL